MKEVWKDMQFRWILLGLVLMPVFVEVGYWTYCDIVWKRKSVEFKDCLTREFGLALKGNLSIGDRDKLVAKQCASFSPTRTVRVWASGDKFLALHDTNGGLTSVWISRTIGNGEEIKSHIDGLDYNPTFWFYEL